ncbi:MlaC/ttg2D family ABC transporter substrate-binding protein [Halioxenophilus aromaticivorans]|uniref:ABC transporter substrate-binding protein n=1 Tax=Halioxenophilus aromaticivorans TaxID=1306992 RepID=A0AAV3U6G8_9ALTE
MLVKFKPISSAMIAAIAVATLASPLVYAADTAKPEVEQGVEVHAIERAADKVSAHEVVSEVTEEVMSIVRKTQTKEVSVEDASVALDEIMSQVVDFRYIVFNVMGRDAVSNASREQLQEFAKVFKQGLIDTYSKGMTTFSDNTVKVVPPKDGEDEGKSVTVFQEVKSDSGTSVVSYSMSVDRSGEWVLRNVVLNGINLGKQFQSQFRAAMKQNNKDLDAVIAAWNA